MNQTIPCCPTAGMTFATFSTKLSNQRPSAFLLLDSSLGGDAAGTVYFAQAGQVLRITSPTDASPSVGSVVGSSTEGYTDGTLSAARFKVGVWAVCGQAPEGMVGKSKGRGARQAQAGILQAAPGTAAASSAWEQMLHTSSSIHGCTSTMQHMAQFMIIANSTPLPLCLCAEYYRHC